MRFIRRHPLVVGILLMFAFTWPAYSAMGLFAGWGLAIPALVFTAIAYGRVGLRSLLRRYLIWRVSPAWYGVAIVGPIIVYLVALFLFSVTTGLRPDPRQAEFHAIFGPAADPLLLAIPFLLLDAITSGEELAWRGFVLPSLQARNNALVSSLLLGLIWGLWHLPKFWATADLNAITFSLLHNMVIAIVYTWVFNSTGGSLLLVTLLHAAFNTAYALLPVNPAGAGSQWILAFVLLTEIVAALAIVATHGSTNLSRRPRVQTGSPVT